MADVLLHEVVDAAAVDSGDLPALMVDGVTRSFSELARDVQSLAGGLLGVSGAGETVAILAPNCYAYVLAYYGVSRAGRLLLPLNQRLHAKEWESQLRRSRTTVLMGEASLLAQLRRDAQIPESVRTVVVLDESAGTDLPFAELLARGEGTNVVAGRRSEVPAWLMFTSGTTGPPKGVLLTHRSLLAGCRHLQFMRPMLADDVFLTAFPLCHVAGYQVMLAHLLRRPAVVMSRFDAADFVAAVRDYGVTTCSLAPTMMDLLLEHLQGDSAGLAVVRRQLRAIGYGSAPMPPSLIRRLTDVLACDLNQGYGMTELAGNVTTLGAAEHRAAINGETALLTSAGTCGPMARLVIMGDDGSLLPTGEPGEIVVRGEQVCGGYFDDPDATAAAVKGGWFHTGDLGILGADGRLTVVDRIKDIIVTGGENVSSRQVEDVLLELPGVREAAVIGMPDERWGERICAVIVADPLHQPDPADLIAGCRAKLAGFKTPRIIEFVTELPRTASGKVRKAELRRQLSP
jgi:acyl-CoA synthetase (AMP-forming)/AMP-acid ligase II